MGFIEETAKLFFPIIIFMGWRYRHEADGLIFGVAAGMGFAAIETAGYAATTLMQNQGSLSAVLQVLVTRGLLSPAGHAAWTGLVCAVLWRERARAGRPIINLNVIAFFLMAVALHAAWDIVNTSNISGWLGIAAMADIAVVSLGALILRYREARRDFRISLTAGGGNSV